MPEPSPRCPVPWCNAKPRKPGRFCWQHWDQMRRNLRVHCKVPNCKNRVGRAGVCNTHWSRWERYRTFEDPELITFVSSQPLVDYFARNGGQAHVLRGLTSRQRKEALKFLDWGCSGNRRIGVRLADDFCIRVLGVHPCMVWGESWWLPPALWEQEAG